ncbi:MAG: polysaccharide deacetylase family protein [Devosiaceae bacterium]|nr:polysaccharide deacetylase family protein [Devosiaceae bacterium]
MKIAQFRYALLNTAFQVLSISKITRLIRKFSTCKGIIFTLHRVLPDKVAPFQPNAILQITPQFLEDTIIKARELGFDIVNLDEAQRRICSKQKEKPFVVFTFDDAYRDNLIYALPILQKHKCPFTLYVPTAFVDGKGELWWQLLEDIISKNDNIILDDGDIETKTTKQKQKAYDRLYWQMRKMPEPERIKLVQTLTKNHNIDLDNHCQNLIMNWQELEIFANEPLCTIGAHTVHHYELAKLSAVDVKKEIKLSADILEKKFGKRPKHFSYPIGAKSSAGANEYQIAKKLGFLTCVTTLPGGLYSEHETQLNHLPRISLNGLFQKKQYIKVFLTGAIFGR